MHRRGQIPTNANSGIASLKMDSAAIIFSESFEILPVLPVFLLCNYRLEEYNSTLWCVSHIYIFKLLQGNKNKTFPKHVRNYPLAGTIRLKLIIYVLSYY